MLPAVHSVPTTSKYRWHPHIHMRHDQYRRIQDNLLLMYRRYRSMLMRRSKDAVSGKIVSLWMHQNCVMVRDMDLYVLPQSMCQWLDSICTSKVAVQVTHQNCTLLVAEKQQ